LGWFGGTDPLEAWMSRPGAWCRDCFRSVSNRPRKTLGYLKPSEKLAELIAHTG